MVTTQEIERIFDAQAITNTGERLGKIKKVYVDDQTGQPKWATVHTGLFGMKENWVPIVDAQVRDDGVVVPYDKNMIENAPKLDEEREHIDPSEEAELYRYYHLTAGETPPQQGPDYGAETPPPTGETYSGRHEADGRETGRADDAMTLSEERVRVGTEQVPAGQARLRKYVVEDVERVEVPVRREEARLVREPITEANRDKAFQGPDITESEHEVTLHQERPVVQTTTEPVERVRLETETVTDTETVEQPVRKERIEAEGDLRPDTRGRR